MAIKAQKIMVGEVRTKPGLGHPVGCTGARIVVSLLHEMERRDLSVGLATACVDGGMGQATIWERV
jgi:acetyl-CoA C-acetyltransferase